MLLKTFLRRFLLKQLDVIMATDQVAEIEPGDVLDIEIKVEVPENVQVSRQPFRTRKPWTARNMDP
jgi:hypothetical protein